uniref:Uncharacterized protein n=1 Tax=Knipowitschia caucasica TaxID=637954 RepID=A0AAV2JJP7_KNICA
MFSSLIFFKSGTCCYFSVCRYTHYYSPKYSHAKVYCPLKLYSPGQSSSQLYPILQLSTFRRLPPLTKRTKQNHKHPLQLKRHRPRKSNTNKIDIF